MEVNSKGDISNSPPDKRTQKKAPMLWVLSEFAWQRPTFTGSCPPIIIGAEELNFRVRHGNGCDLFAIVTRHREHRSLKTE